MRVSIVFVLLIPQKHLGKTDLRPWFPGFAFTWWDIGRNMLIKDTAKLTRGIEMPTHATKCVTFDIVNVGIKANVLVVCWPSYQGPESEQHDRPRYLPTRNLTQAISCQDDNDKTKEGCRNDGSRGVIRRVRAVFWFPHAQEEEVKYFVGRCWFGHGSFYYLSRTDLSMMLPIGNRPRQWT